MSDLESQGTTANLNGADHEQATLERILANYRHLPLVLDWSDATEHWRQFQDGTATGLSGVRPIHTVLIEAAGVAADWLGRTTHSDICILRPDGQTALIECKTQSKHGSVIEKLPGILLKLLNAPVDHRIIVLEGDKLRKYQGYVLINAFMLGFGDLISAEARDALLSGAIQVMSLDEFTDWHRAFIWATDHLSA